MMRKRELLFLSLVLAGFSWNASQVCAESQDLSSSSPQQGSYRNPENIPKFRSTTNAQREEAAKRVAERRAAAGLNPVKGNNPAETISTPQDKEGGTK